MPDEIRAGYELPTEYPRTLVQTAVQDEIAERVTIPGAETADYVSTHRISTPAVARQRIMDTADFLRSV